MSIRFATRTLCYCLGKGRLSLRGARSRLWLEIKRPEDEHTYLKHQAKILRQLHHGDLEFRWDRKPGRSFYDTIILQVRSDQLWPAYEWLYRGDKRQVSITALEQGGLQGLGALWCDSGFRTATLAEVRIQDCCATPEELTAWGESLGFPLAVRQERSGRMILRWRGETARLLMKTLRPTLHPTKRSTTWPPRRVRAQLYI